MIQAKVLHVKAKTKEQAEIELGNAFNTWQQENKLMEIYHIFEPVRIAETYGDSTYNTYHVTMTFFYTLREPCKESITY